jgi:hypothetical protein
LDTNTSIAASLANQVTIATLYGRLIALVAHMDHIRVHCGEHT